MEQQDRVDIALEEAQAEIDSGSSRPFLDIYFHNEREGFAIGAFGYFFVTQDGGVNWHDASLSVPNPDGLHLYAISPAGDDALVMVGEFGLALRSVDGGTRWTALDVGYQGSLFNVARSDERGGVVIAGLRGNAFYSADGGLQWTPLELPSKGSLIAVQAIGNGKLALVGSDGKLIVGDAAANRFAVIASEDRGALAVVLPLTQGKLLLAGRQGYSIIKAE